MDALDILFSRLARSSFRSRFRLAAKDEAYLKERGIDTILLHAADFIARRIGPANPPNDGKQTPMRGHPRFCSPACHGDMLPRLPFQMACHSNGAGTDSAAAGLYRRGHRALAAFPKGVMLRHKI